MKGKQNKEDLTAGTPDRSPNQEVREDEVKQSQSPHPGRWPIDFNYPVNFR